MELPKIIAENLTIKPVTWAHEVLEIALTQKIKPVIWEDDPITDTTTPPKEEVEKPEPVIDTPEPIHH